MGIAAAAKQMSALNDQLERAIKEQEKILANAKKLDAIQGSGGIAGQQALQGGQLVGAGAQALPGDPGGLKAFLKSVFRVIGGGETALASTGGGGGAGVNATASSSRSAPGIRGAREEPSPFRDQSRPFLQANPFNVALLGAINGMRRDFQRATLRDASTRSSR